MQTMTRTLIALQEATVRTTRGGEDAFARAALGARHSPGKKSSVYVDKKGGYSYGIASQKTGGKTTPKGSTKVGEITPGSGKDVVLRRPPKAGRMKKQQAGIAGSSRLSPEERSKYAAAAKAKEGRMALPAGALAGMKRATYGVGSHRKVATRAQPAKARTIGALARIGGAMKAAASRALTRGRRKRLSA